MSRDNLDSMQCDNVLDPAIQALTAATLGIKLTALEAVAPHYLSPHEPLRRIPRPRRPLTLHHRPPPTMQTTELDPTLSQTLDRRRQARPDARHRQQELFVLVDAAVGGDDRVRHPVPGSAGAARPARHRHPHRRIFRRRPGAGAGRRRDDDLGQPGDLRIPGRAVPRPAPVAAGRRRARDGAFGDAPRCIPASPACAARCR